MKLFPRDLRSQAIELFSHFDEVAKRDVFMACGRKDFPQFYARASADEVELIDTMILIHVALIVGINISRDWLPTTVRDELERRCDATERVFMHLRDLIRGCVTFRLLNDADRRKIETVLFKLHPVNKD